MSKEKSRLFGFMLAAFTGPISYIYVNKWKKTLWLLPLMFVPYINAAVYVLILFGIISDVKKYNRNIFSEVRYGIVVCKCGSHNKAYSKFCSDCGFKLTKKCDNCDMQVLNDKCYCNHCGHAFDNLIKKNVKKKKVALFAAASLLALILLSLTLFVAVEQHKEKEYTQNLTLENFEYPAKVKGNKFNIHYELSDKQMQGTKGLRTYINGTYVYTNDSEAKFDGKSIDWIVHLKKKGPINFNVSLYHYDNLLDSRQLSINVTA
ncbi:MAG: hypothetical protein Q8R04_02795 [Nanoarchaeota archaeon]|nr:hypothetical protein [Nanoarchaeota archaeon]